MKEGLKAQKNAEGLKAQKNARSFEGSEECRKRKRLRKIKEDWGGS